MLETVELYSQVMQDSKSCHSVKTTSHLRISNIKESLLLEVKFIKQQQLQQLQAKLKIHKMTKTQTISQVQLESYQEDYQSLEPLEIQKLRLNSEEVIQMLQLVFQMLNHSKLPKIMISLYSLVMVFSISSQMKMLQRVYGTVVTLITKIVKQHIMSINKVDLQLRVFLRTPSTDRVQIT